MQHVVWIVLLALGAALAVLVVAGSADGRQGGLREFASHLRSGLRPGRRTDGGGLLSDVRSSMVEAADDPSVPVEEIFSIGRPVPTGYVHPGEITATLNRATSRAVRGVSQLARR